MRVLLLLLLSVPAGAVHDASFAPKNYLVYYGSWGPTEIEKAKPFELIILHPGETMSNITPRLVKKLQRGGKTKVIAYVSIGESKTVPLGPAAAGEKGFPSWFLDADKNGLPDENGRWGSYFVNAGDSAWKKNRITRMHAIKKRLHVDGFFLDTLDTASPWGKYGWMQKHMARFVWDIGSEFPKDLIIANRGLFLFQTFPKLIGPAIDGLMFESFISEWDWHRKVGVTHPWLKSNIDLMKTTLLPQAAKRNGFHLFLLNYVDPSQSDFYNLDADLHDALGTSKRTNYYTTPDLHRLEPPPETFYKKSKKLPHIKTLEIDPMARGDFSASILLTGTQQLTLGVDYFLDLRYSGTRLREDQLLFAERIAIDSDILTLEDSSEGKTLRLKSYGLKKFKQYFFYLRVRGPNPKSKGPLVRKSVLTQGGPWPDTVSSVLIKPGDGHIDLQWEAPHAHISAYHVYMGAHPSAPNLMTTVKTTSARVEHLRNGNVYYFSVAAKDKKGRLGGLSRPKMGIPVATKGPLPPTRLTVTAGRGTLKIQWDAPKTEGVNGYRLTCQRLNGGPRLPIKIPKEKTERTLSGLQRNAVYTVFVTAVGQDELQSIPTPPINIRTQ
ncbi:MAG: hypothetical protein COB53_08805 [Elusimicrobia bacterium]|nr:MAG: hypothetical protein COB53_08805 [Elusimicrobiota bacterium]